jgi:hypothetical protein
VNADVEVRAQSLTTGVDKHLTREIVDDVVYSATGVGGFEACTFTLPRPLTEYRRDVDPYVAITVADPATGEVLWDGWLTNPGKGSERGADLWDVTAVGPRAHANDLPQPVIYVDTRLDQWERVEDFSASGIPNATVDYTGGTGETPGLRVGFARGLQAPPGASVSVRYPHIAASGQGIGRAQVVHFEGLTTGNANLDLVMRLANLSGVIAETQTWNVSPQSLDGAGASYRYVDWRARLTVGGTVGTDVTYAQASSMLVKGTRVDASGHPLTATSDYSGDYVTCQQVIADLLGRMLPLYDGVGAVVDPSAAAHIQQLAYENGADAAQILTDLMAQAPSHRWAAWERNETGRYRFEWVPWDTTPTIYAPAAKLTSPGSAADLYDTVKVRWVNAQKKVSWATYTQEHPLLAAAGRHRTKLVDLGSETGSADAAASVAAATLADGLWPTNNGTVTITAPVVDMVLGRTVHPRELPRYAGRLIRLRDVEGWTSTLNPSDRDGAAVYRMAQVSYSARDRAATVTLDAYEDTIEAALVRLGRLQSRLRRP